MTNAAMHNSEASLELTEAELNHVSSGTAPKQEAVFPTETIKFTYGAIEWTYTPQR